MHVASACGVQVTFPPNTPPNTDNDVDQKQCLVLKNTLTVWHNCLAHLGETPKLSQFSPIFGNDDFRPGRVDAGFTIWASQGVAKVADFYNENVTLM